MYRLLLRLKRFIKRYLKVKSESRQGPAVGAKSKVYKLIMLLAAAMLIALLYPSGSLFDPLNILRKGEIATDDIISPFQITINKSEKEMEEERETAKNAIPIIIEYDSQLADSIMSRFNQFMDAAQKASDRIDEIEQKGNIEAVALDSIVDAKTDSIVTRFPLMDRNAVRELITEGNPDFARTVISEIFKNTIYSYGLLSDVENLPNKTNRPIIIRIDDRDYFVVRDKLLDRNRAFLAFRSALKARSQVDSLNVDLYYQIGRHFIIPNLTINYKEMEERQDEALAQISPVKETISEGDLVVSAGSRVNERQEMILRQIENQKKARAQEQGWYNYYMPLLARFLLVLALFIILYSYLYHFRPQVYQSNPKILALFLIYALELVLIYVVDVKLQLNYPMYLFPIPIFAMLITILFDAQMGIINTFVLAGLLGILHRFNFPLALITIVAGTVACYSTQRVRRRSEFFRSVLYLAVTYVVMIYLLESFKVSPTDAMLTMMGMGILNALISPLLTIGILPIFESIFGFTTDITLLELSDLNHPLLKRLALEAPGTYHHSIIVGNLAEAAAKEINANPLLARVGAYYHDIGKIEIPEYFVENQLGIKSKHDALTPTMSAIILASHVKKGRLMGEEADLPDEVLNFIEEHHGTMTMNYFLNKAKEMGDEAPDETDFRYPGPKPQLRETATVMLADSVEAASRTLADPKPARIRNLVQNIINDRFRSGELEECPLTLKDLAEIRESFVQILIGVFHQRVEYPKKETVE